MLEYDNSAFYYFMISILAIYLIPGWYYNLRYIIRQLAPGTDKNVARTKLEQKKLARMRANKRGSQNLKTCGFIINFVLLVLATIIFVYLVSLVWFDSELARFDPYKILAIDFGATDKQIKKAYKVKALEFHPDRNNGDKKAEQMFMMVAKAYEALTDAVAKDNWEKFGNPDGKQSLEVSIGLPTFLLDKDNHNVILIVYLICLVVIIPAIVGVWYARSKKYGENNVMYATYGFFARFGLTENSSVKMLPEVLAAADEFIQLNTFKDKETYEHVKNLHRILRGKNMDGVMAKPRFDKIPTGIIITKGNIMLHAHLARHSLEQQGVILPPEWQKDLDTMLTQTNSLITAMLDICVQSRWMQTALNVMEFSQYLTQGLWVKDAKHLQLPHILPRDVKHMFSGKGGSKDFKEYLKFDDDLKKGLSNLDDSDRMDVLRVCSMIPNIDVQLKYFVEDEEEIAERDTVTLQVTITRTNIADGEKAPPVHAPYYPGKKEECWWVLLSEVEHKHLVRLDKVTDQSKVVVHETMFMAPQRKGTYKFNVHVISDSYLGLDQQIPFDMKVISSEELPEYEPHKEDLDLDNEASLFEQVLTQNQDSDESSDEEEEEVVTEDKDSNLTEAEKRKRLKRKALQARKGKDTKPSEAVKEAGDDTSTEEEDERQAKE